MCCLCLCSLPLSPPLPVALSLITPPCLALPCGWMLPSWNFHDMATCWPVMASSPRDCPAAVRGSIVRVTSGRGARPGVHFGAGSSARWDPVS
jgi:hypothetical protein